MELRSDLNELEECQMAEGFTELDGGAQQLSVRADGRKLPESLEALRGSGRPPGLLYSFGSFAI